mmetsp:Transcript_3455/g.12393  ORF Transcript_3455/g.12393 Transcript_3455/m.12393 type:complete len:266 (+) Transcript_3455:618-1415(+)
MEKAASQAGYWVCLRKEDPYPRRDWHGLEARIDGDVHHLRREHAPVSDARSDGDVIRGPPPALGAHLEREPLPAASRGEKLERRRHHHRIVKKRRMQRLPRVVEAAPEPRGVPRIDARVDKVEVARVEHDALLVALAVANLERVRKAHGRERRRLPRPRPRRGAHEMRCAQVCSGARACGDDHSADAWLSGARDTRAVVRDIGQSHVRQNCKADSFFSRGWHSDKIRRVPRELGRERREPLHEVSVVCASARDVHIRGVRKGSPR